VDERKLEALFQDAARAAPPAGFDEQDVARASRRVTARRRVAGTGGAVVAAAVLVGGVGIGTGAFDQGSSGIAEQPAPQPHPQAPAQPLAEPGTQDGSGQTKTRPGVMSLPGGDSGCESPDQQLAAAVSEQLPEARNASPAPAAGECPSGSRAAEFHLREGAASGTLSVRVSPVGSVPQEQRTPGESQQPGGAEQATARTGSGKVLVVRSQPDVGSAPPYGERLTSVASELAGRV
jgi:hypothetical protein